MPNAFIQKYLISDKISLKREQTCYEQHREIATLEEDVIINLKPQRFNNQSVHSHHQEYYSYHIFVFGDLLATNALQQPKTIVDPWIVDDRLWLYQAILNGTHVPTLFGNDNKGNYLYGLDIQMGWQFQSGRLNDHQQQAIPLTAWWGDMNYYLSVIPYLGALRVGLVPQVTITWPSINSTNIAGKFCTNYVLCSSNVKDIVDDWVDYFTLIQQFQQTPPTNLTTAKTQLLTVMWKAHTSSIEYAATMFPSELALLGSKESKFGNGWGNFVEVLAIIQFETNFTQVTEFSTSLPPRRLRFFDIPPFIVDMTKEQNNVVASILGVNEMVTKLPLVWSAFLETLKLMMKNPQCQTLISNAFQSYLSSPFSTLIETFLEILKGFVLLIVLLIKSVNGFRRGHMIDHSISRDSSIPNDIEICIQPPKRDSEFANRFDEKSGEGFLTWSLINQFYERSGDIQDLFVSLNLCNPALMSHSMLLSVSHFYIPKNDGDRHQQ
ncbi:hypothetical protein DFA_04034 [Cavenderia fasciculata]|uniref:Uncharacterized protein n=1 Tax=Cavenderia fasciculata TaxID=261658 RepID=F4Q139_CACFS|nr:uncharacterized protein DFA_04034 [Cavenderia fasciculata]EGG18540.1 hypothetical protein DFA_04034 [Cavenderia fasciculata]|eukprot:XP_004366444.1 hypothetical protein DFA_04034 [Cavenderia fasciculata]